MSSFSSVRKIVVAAALALAPAASFAGIFISVGFAPPALPVYVQPVCPNPGYLWNPGYWAYSDEGYYWVPGVWVQPPSYGVLWTPPYWGFAGGVYGFHAGYWGPHVGFYGGVNYGFGYGGAGFGGGRWVGNSFSYNTAVNNVNVTNIHNTYVDRTVINNTTINNHTSFNGGPGGIQARPTAQEAAVEHENHIPPTAAQQSHIQSAHAEPSNFAKANGGRPQNAAFQSVGSKQGIVAAHGAQPRPAAEAANHPAATANHPQAQARPQQSQPRPQAQARPQPHAQPQSHPQAQHEGGGHEPKK
jgi:WXXGXW repeat (2 copies)